MIIDCNAFLGNWASRRLRHNDVPALLAMMDHFGIDRACVASADAILYRDAHAGNEKIREETRSHRNRFWCYATINPAYAGWQRDLRTCVDWGFKGMRLYPYYHHYALDGPEGAAVLDAAAEAGLPVSIPLRVVDARQRHWMDTATDLGLGAVVAAAEAHPKTRFLVSETVAGMAPSDGLWKRLRALPVYFEISRMTSVFGNSVGTLVRTLGTDRALLGTGFPFKTPSPAFLKVEILDEGDLVNRRILGENAQKLFEAT